MAACENKVRGPALPTFMASCEATLIRTVWCCWENRNVELWDRIASPEIDLHRESEQASERADKRRKERR